MSVCLSDCGSLFALKRDDGRQCENYSRLYIWLLKDRGKFRHQKKRSQCLEIGTEVFHQFRAKTRR